MAKKVTVIKAAKAQKHTQEERRLKVCGYARVSTGSQAQATSYTAQVEYYTEKIESNPLWEFAGVYADEGISGTNVKHRDEFQMMISDCEDGNIDLILTKSITRFARNTVECIQTIRKLKEIGVGIYFEKENINTLSEKSELFITILASVAQGESENISSNNRWAIQKRFQDGTYIISTPAYGYGKDEDGNLVIIESEAETVRWIYESYLNGMGVYVIAKALNQKGIPTIRGAEKWQDGVIQDILKNPIYEGDMLQQRTYTETRFPFVRRVNNGQRNQYLIKDSHPPIVTHEEAEAVRNLMAYRVDVLHMNKSDYTKRYLFSGRIICGECGRTFRRQKIYIGKPYEKIIWTCSGHVEDKESCCMKAIREDVLHRAFTDMWNKLYTNQGTILEPLLKELTELVAARQDSEEIRQLDKEIKDISEQSQILNQVMRKGYMDSALFMESSSKLGWQLTECRRKKTLLTRKLRRTKEIVRTEQLIQLIAEQDGLMEEFDEQLFKMTAEKIVVSKEHDITFCLYNGLKLTEREVDRMQWHMPIGYKVVDGKITICEEQRKIVEQIFTDYDSGVAAGRIAQNLKGRNICNAKGKVSWTHASIGRILENPSYLGTEYYPQLIGEELFERVQCRREKVRAELGRADHRPGRMRESSSEVSSGVQNAGQYAAISSRATKKERGGTAKWKCKSYVTGRAKNCRNSFITDGQAKQVCVEAINAVIRNKGLLRVHRQEEKVSPQYRVLERNLQRMKEEQERTETDLMKLLYERAEERYRTLEVRDGEFRTEEIKNILAGKKELETFDENLYRKIIARIWVHGGNMAEVELINGSRVTAGYKD